MQRYSSSEAHSADWRDSSTGNELLSKFIPTFAAEHEREEKGQQLGGSVAARN